MKSITTRAHGMMDYIIGLALILAPYIFGFAEVGGAAVAVPTTLGIGIIFYSLLTRYELGLIKALPMKAHLTLDYIGGIFLAVSPFLFDFADQAPNVWLPHIIVGAIIFLETLMTETEPRGLYATA